VRNLESTGQWFTGLLIALFALPAIAVYVAIGSGLSFWRDFLPMACAVVVGSLLPRFLDRLARAPRFLAWICIGLAAGVAITMVKGKPVDMVTAAVLALVLAVGDFLAEYFRSRRDAELG
jgi:ABC-type amino acid transport system permease subunit